MLEVTPEALHYMRHALEDRGARDDVAMRLTRAEGGIDVVPDRAQPTDLSFELDGRRVLIVDEVLANAMDGERLCVAEHPSGESELYLDASA